MSLISNSVNIPDKHAHGFSRRIIATVWDLKPKRFPGWEIAEFDSRLPERLSAKRPGQENHINRHTVKGFTGDIADHAFES